MPSVLIEVRKAYSQSEEIAIIEAVHNALLTSFKTRPQDKNVRLIVHAAHRFACALPKPELFTHITVDCFVGRSKEAKALLYKTIVENLAPFGIPADHIEIIVREMERVNFGIRGGIPASDVELGFKVDV